MKKTKYNQGGLSARGSNEKGLDLSYNSPKVSAYRNTKDNVSSVTVRDEGKSATVTKTPTSTSYGAEVNGKRVSYTDSQGHKQLEGGIGKYNAGVGKNSSGDVNAHVGYNGKNYNARVSKDQRGTSVNVGARKGNFSAEAGKGPDGSSVRLTYSKSI